jgi:hypothetical protein
VKRIAAVLVALSLLACVAGAIASCSLFHQDYPGTCSSGTDCFKFIETCDVVQHVCVPIYDAGPRPDAGPDAATIDAAVDGGSDAAADAGPDGGPDAAGDAAIDAGVPDAT